MCSSDLNGQQFDVLEVKHVKATGRKKGTPAMPEHYLLTVGDEDGPGGQLPCHPDGFQATAKAEGVAKAEARRGRKLVAATFADAITAHKAQGSQWGRVLVVDQSSAFRFIEMKAHGRPYPEANREGRRWLYTAVTRAAEQVTVVAKAGVEL